jgi:hypothetical protein
VLNGERELNYEYYKQEAVWSSFGLGAVSRGGIFRERGERYGCNEFTASVRSCRRWSLSSPPLLLPSLSSLSLLAVRPTDCPVVLLTVTLEKSFTEPASSSRRPPSEGRARCFFIAGLGCQNRYRMSQTKTAGAGVWIMTCLTRFAYTPFQLKGRANRPPLNCGPRACEILPPLAICRFGSASPLAHSFTRFTCF